LINLVVFLKKLFIAQFYFLENVFLRTLKHESSVLLWYFNYFFGLFLSIQSKKIEKKKIFS